MSVTEAVDISATTASSPSQDYTPRRSDLEKIYEVAIALVTGARSKKTRGPVISSSTCAATFTALTNSELLLLINSCFALTRKWKTFAILRQMLTKFQHQIAGKIAAKEKYMWFMNCILPAFLMARILKSKGHRRTERFYVRVRVRHSYDINMTACQKECQ